MPVSEFLAKKWEARLYNWLLWRGPKEDKPADDAAGDAAISSIWRMDELGTTVARSGYRESGKAVLSGQAGDTDALLHVIRRKSERIYRALVAWVENDGSRGAQAARLSTDRWTYDDWVDSGIRALERLSRGEDPGLK